MSKRMMLLAMAWMVWGTPAAAQGTAQLDSLIAHWIAVGPSSHWQPFHLFEGCPNLTPEQERGIDQVLNLQLEDHRRSLRTRALGLPFAACGHQRLERWFFDQMDEAIRAGTLSGDLDLQVAFRNANTAPVRQYLARVMTSRELPDYAREVAGFTLLEHLSPDERLDAHLAAFEAGTLPWGIATGGTRRILREDGARLVARMSGMVLRNPLLARETAFMQVAESSAPFLSDELRRSLGEALAQGLRARPDLDTAAREELGLLAEWLRQPRRREVR